MTAWIEGSISSASRAAQAYASASVTSPSTTRCWAVFASLIEATQPGTCGWLPGGGAGTVSTSGGELMSCATMLRARASCRDEPSWPRSAATECRSSRFAFIIVSTEGEPGR
jgi:hypothetical protein